MMKKSCVFVAAMLLVIFAFAQNKTAATGVVDVDRLYQMYKGKSQVTFYSGGHAFTARIAIHYNSLKQPYAIILYGDAYGDLNNSIGKVKKELSDTKIKAGYKLLTGIRKKVDFEQNGVIENNIPVSVYYKGTQYAKYGVKKALDREKELPPPVVDTLLPVTNTPPAPRYISDFFYFEVGDSSRKEVKRPDSKLEF